MLPVLGGCAAATPPVNLSLERPVVPPEPVKNAKIVKDPETGIKGFWISPLDMAADLKWKIEAVGEIKKGQVNTDKANEAFKRLEKWVN